MFQLLLRSPKRQSKDWQWSCLAVRPKKSNTEIILEEELIDALVDALDFQMNPMMSVMDAGGDTGVVYAVVDEVYVVYEQTLTNVFIPLAILPLDDAHLVCAEMRESTNRDQIKVAPVPQSVNYPRLAYALATQTEMLCWW